MENVRKRRNIIIFTNNDSFKKYVKKPNYKGVVVGNEDDDFVVIERQERQEVVMNKPFQIGFSILELSKTLMYKWHYDYMKPKYRDKASLCYMDTDSFVYYIETEDFYEDIKNDIKENYDTSCYVDKIVPFRKGMNKKKVGLMKDETGDEEIKVVCCM